MSAVRTVVATLGASAILLTGGVLVGSPAVAAPVPDVIDVTDAPYNAVGDGVTDNTAAIQQALDDVAVSGGTVVLPSGGTFLVSGVQIGSDTTLQVDGMLLQSQDPEHYTYEVALGHRPGPLKNDLSMFQNLPFVFSTHAQNVAVVGDGVIQQTRAATENQTIHSVAVGFFEVTGFEIRDVEILGSSAYSVAIYASRDGVVAGTRIIPGSHYGATPNNADANTDGISIMNSQHLRITGNYVRTSDDGIYVTANYDDPRYNTDPGVADRWLSFDEPQDTRFIEVDNNDVHVTCCKAFTFIAWGIDAPDQRTVEISDIYVHNNKLSANGDAVGCWCSASYANDDASPGQSPMTRVVFEDNEYIGRVDNTFNTADITDLKTDFGARGARDIQNGDFEFTGMAWWSSDRAQAEDVGAVDQSDVTALRDSDARVAFAQMDGWAAFLQPSNSAPARLYQGLGLSPEAVPDVAFDTSRYSLSADIVSNGEPVRLFAFDTCAQADLAEVTVAPLSRTTVSLPFTVVSSCDNIRLGFEASGDGAWALIDNVAVTSAVNAIDDPDPMLTYVGAWQRYNNADAWGGTNMVSRVAGEYVEIPFTGTRALVVGGTDYNLGIGDVYLNGTLVGSADWYSPTKTFGQVTFDTGTLPHGDHVLRMVTTGTKNPASAGTIVAFDVLLIENDAPDVAPPTVSIDFAPVGEAGWLAAGAELTVSASDADSGVESVEYRLGDGAWTEYAGPVALSDGEYSVSARATDVAGNVSAVVSQSVKVDSLAPEAWVWLDEGGAVSAFARDAGPSGIDRIEYSLDEGVTWLEDLSALIAVDAAPAGFLYRAADVAGNTSAAQTVSGSVLPVEVAADDRILVEFSGFEAGDQVHVELHSDPVRLGTFAANSVGVVSVLVTVPSTFESGTHGLVAFTGSGGAGAGGGEGSLGSTGTEPLPLALGGLLVLLLGAVALATTRIRRATLTNN